MSAIVPWVSKSNGYVVSREVQHAIWRSTTGDESLGEGPYYPLRSTHPIWIARGPVPRHSDGAGITYGLVIAASGNQRLIVDGQEMPLCAGGLFRIDSDADHATACDDDGVLIFHAYDWYGTDPNVSISAWAKEAIREMMP